MCFYNKVWRSVFSFFNLQFTVINHFLIVSVVDGDVPAPVDPKILFLESLPDSEKDNLSCDFSAAVAEDERLKANVTK